MDYRRKFGNTELLTEYAYIKKLSKAVHKLGNNFDILSIEMLADIMNYSAWLNETPITTEILKELFEVVLLSEKNGNGYLSVSFSIESRMEIQLLKIIATQKEVITLIIPPTNNNQALNTQIRTLADLARLTAAKPIPLA